MAESNVSAHPMAAVIRTSVGNQLRHPRKKTRIGAGALVEFKYAGDAAHQDAFAKVGEP